jgi:hypothetical protein
MYHECSSWVLVTIDLRNARPWGVASDVMVRRRSGCQAASDQATAPPQS